MKNLYSALILITLCIACKKADKTQEPEEQKVITGKLYGVTFTAKTVIERYNSFFRMPKYTPEQLFAIYISPDANKSCSSSENEFLIRLSVPKKIGRFSLDDTYVLVTDPKDPTGQDGALFSSENTVIEVISITKDKVIGKVDIKGLDASTEFKGSFEANICN